MSSQEKVTKHITTLEELIEKTKHNDCKELIKKEYFDFITEEIKTENEQENHLILKQKQHEIVQCDWLASNYASLKEEVDKLRCELSEKIDDIDSLTFQAIANRQRFKIEKAEKERQLKLFYEKEYENELVEFENRNYEYTKIENELQNQITLEKATRNARLHDIRGNLQRQISERNTDLLKAQCENKDLRKTMEELKSEVQNKLQKIRNRFKMMHFRPGVPRYTISSTRPKPSSITLNFDTLPTNIENYEYQDRTNACSSLLPTILIQRKDGNSTQKRTRSDQININFGKTTNKNFNVLDFQKDYKELEANFNLASKTVGSREIKIKPNPFSITANRERLPETDNFVSNIIKTSPKRIEESEIEDELSFLDMPIKQNETFQGQSNTIRYQPKLYMGNIRSKKYKKVDS